MRLSELSFTFVNITAKGTVAILGPRSKANSEHIRSITDSVEVPFIETRWNYRPQDVMGEYIKRQMDR